MRDLTTVDLPRNVELERRMIRGDHLPPQVRERAVVEHSPKEFAIFEWPVGMFLMRAIAGVGEGWDHVSVSVFSYEKLTQTRCPTWEEMDYVKRLLFEKDEVVMQLHVAESDHISHHPYVLHLWRPHRGRIPLPPKLMV